MTMRIAHITATFPPYYSGTGMVCYHNAVGLGQAGHRVAVLTANHPSGTTTYPPEITVLRLPVVFRIGNAPLLPGLLALLRPANFDIIHLHYPFYFGGEALLLASLLSDIRYVITYHQDVLFAGWMSLADRLHHRLIGARILTRAQKVLATSWDYARASRVGALLRSRPHLVGEMPNGVDTTRFRPEIDSTALRSRYHLSADDRLVLFVGALDQAHFFKGIHVLLEAMQQISDPRVKLLIVGDGELRMVYQQQAVGHGIGDRVIFCGRVSDAELPMHYALCDVLVLPSVTMGEAFGMVLIEALACGTPVIASSLPGVRSVVRDGEDGLLVPPGDVDALARQLQLLLGDLQRRQDMGRRGCARVQATYAWQVLIPRLEAVYHEVLAGGN